MSIDNLPANPGPVDDTPLSQTQGADAIADLLDDSDLDPNPEEDHEAKPAAEGDDDALLDDEGVDDLEPGAEDAGEDEPENDDGPQNEPYSGGRFAADNAKVTLEDGTVTTVAELKRNNLFQRDYTKKTTELSAEREQITARKSEVDQVAQQLSQEREFLTWFAETNLPKRPEVPTVSATTDPFAHVVYNEQIARYNQMVEAWQTFQSGKQAEEARKTEETTRSRSDRLRGEVARLVEALPILKDAAKRQPFLERLTREAAENYGLEANQVLSAEDHRMLVVLADANAYRRLKQKTPQVQKEVAAKPHLVTGGKRAAPQAKVSRDRQARVERLRNSGSREAGIAALMDLDL